MTNRETHVYKFAAYRLDTGLRELRCTRCPPHEQVIDMPPKVFDLLVELIQNSAEIKVREGSVYRTQSRGRWQTIYELLRALWPEEFDENFRAQQNPTREGGNKKRKVKHTEDNVYGYVSKLNGILKEHDEKHMEGGSHVH